METLGRCRIVDIDAWGDRMMFILMIYVSIFKDYDGSKSLVEFCAWTVLGVKVYVQQCYRNTDT